MELGVTKAELIQRSSTSMDPAAPQNPDILLRSAARLPLAWVLLHHGIQVFLLRSMARSPGDTPTLQFICRPVHLGCHRG
ncbi:hypothetical protein V5799_024616 [Amblyomma americanum]|uniref:Uncharacterized protein n=1 Tax=Amblyomma americanum TaxID=6943 RepID=A0AAQ4EBX2_AMBAM